MSLSSHCDETNPIGTILQLSIVLCVIFLRLLLMRRVYNLGAILFTENTEQPTRCLFFRDSTSNTSSSEDEEQHTDT